jgi:hypothetical protein
MRFSVFLFKAVIRLNLGIYSPGPLLRGVRLLLDSSRLLLYKLQTEAVTAGRGRGLLRVPVQSSEMKAPFES